MRKLFTCIIFLLLVGVCAPSFAEDSQVYFHDKAQKEARKQQKLQNKQYKRIMKQQNKTIKKQRKEAAKQTKAWAKR